MPAYCVCVCDTAHGAPAIAYKHIISHGSLCGLYICVYKCVFRTILRTNDLDRLGQAGFNHYGPPIERQNGGLWPPTNSERYPVYVLCSRIDGL